MGIISCFPVIRISFPLFFLHLEVFVSFSSKKQFYFKILIPSYPSCHHLVSMETTWAL